MKGPDLRSWIKNKAIKENLGWVLFLASPILTLFLLINFFYSHELLGPISAKIMLFYIGFFTVVFIAFKLFLIRFFVRKKRIFLKTYEIILHPAVNLILLSILFLCKVRAGINFNLLIGIWVILSAFFALYVAFIWLSSFSKGKNSFQIFWTYHLAAKTLKLYVFTLLLLVLVYVVFTLTLPQYFLGIGLVNTTATLFRNYLILIVYHFFILTIAILAVAGTVSINDVITKKYTKIALGLVKNRFSKKVGQKVFTSTEEHARIFPDIINRVNGLLKLYHIEIPHPLIFNASVPPRILNKDLYPKKLLIAEIVQDKKRLNKQDKKRLGEVKDGLDKMSNSLENEGDRFFYPFVEGLTQLANSGETKPRFKIEDGFELKPLSFTRRVKENQVLIGIVLTFFIGVISIILNMIF